jgi:intracellular sulfur oxidation DsrE/DsrF family protein
LRECVLLVLVFGLQFPAFAEGEDTPAETKSEVQSETVPPGYVFGVTVSSVQELDVILDRADSLRKLFDPDQHGRIAIVLHGDELQLFQKDNYAANQSIVERARLLDEEKVIDIKACQTQMRLLEIEASELPGFIEQVPFAPVEIERLEKEHGFTRL